MELLKLYKTCWDSSWAKNLYWTIGHLSLYIYSADPTRKLSKLQVPYKVFSVLFTEFWDRKRKKYDLNLHTFQITFVEKSLAFSFLHAFLFLAGFTFIQEIPFLYSILILTFLLCMIIYIIFVLFRREL